MDKVKTILFVDDIMESFKIKVKHVVVRDDNQNDIKFLAIGGGEVIAEVNPVEGFDKLLMEVGLPSSHLAYEDNQPLFYKYTNTPFSIKKLEELQKFRSMKSLSKEKALEINGDIKNKDELENELVYITDNEPMTNSLALAKQFDLKHKNVILKLYELGAIYPSVLMKIKPDVCSYTSVVGGRPKTETVGDKKVAEYSATIKTQTTYDTFLHVPEDVYYVFLKKLSTPKGIDTIKGMTKLIHLDGKQDEYFDAFKKVRSFLYDSGVKKDEIDAMIKIRTENTSILMREIYAFVTRYNSTKSSNRLNLVSVNRFIFNIINYLNGINAVNYKPATEEELKAGKTRQTKEEYIQTQLAQFEGKVSTALHMANVHDLTIIDVMVGVTMSDKNKLIEILKAYDVEYLWDELNK